MNIKINESNKSFNGIRSLSMNETEETLKYLSPILGMAYESVKDNHGKITRRGLIDSTLGTSAKTNEGILGKAESIGDIDIAVDSKKYNFDQLVSRVVERLGAEHVGKPIRGLSLIPIKVPIGGLSENGYAQVDLILGDPALLEFTYGSPDPSANSQYKGSYRNILMNSVLQNMRRQIRDSESKEVVALVGPKYSLNQGIEHQWRHYPISEDGRSPKMKAISLQEFNQLYPEHVGKEKELSINTPQGIMEYMFPNVNIKREDFDSFEKLRDLIIEHKPMQAEGIFNHFSNILQKEGFTVPTGLIVEAVEILETTRVLNEVRNISLGLVTESLVKRQTFEEFREKCKSLITDAKQTDHFNSPLANADLIPSEGIEYLLKKTSLFDDWNKLEETDYNNNFNHMVNDKGTLYTDLCELMLPDDFFFVTEHYGLKLTPESFVSSLLGSN